MSQAEVPLERIHVFYGKWVRSNRRTHFGQWQDLASSRLITEVKQPQMGDCPVEGSKLWKTKCVQNPEQKC